MAEFLVRVVDKVNPDSVYLDAKCLKRGDVVCVCEDGWKWSDLERKNPEWHIIQVPGMSVIEGSQFLAEEPGDPQVNQMLQRRQFKIDVDALMADHPSLDVAPVTLSVSKSIGGKLQTVEQTAIVDKASILANARAVDVVTLDAKALLAAKVMKVALEDPAVIGDVAAVAVIG